MKLKTFLKETLAGLKEGLQEIASNKWLYAMFWLVLGFVLAMGKTMYLSDVCLSCWAK